MSGVDLPAEIVAEHGVQIRESVGNGFGHGEKRLGRHCEKLGKIGGCVGVKRQPRVEGIGGLRLGVDINWNGGFNFLEASAI